MRYELWRKPIQTDYVSGRSRFYSTTLLQAE